MRLQNLRKFVFEIGRTSGIVQYDKEAPLKTMARDLCKVVGGMSMRSAPTGHSQSQGSVGNAPTNSLWPTANTVVSSGSVHWSEGELGITIVHVEC